MPEQKTVCPSCETEALMFALAGVDGAHVICRDCGQGFFLMPEDYGPLSDAFSMSFAEDGSDVWT